MRAFAEACERVRATTKKLEKIAIVAEHLAAHAGRDAKVRATFFAGGPFAAWEEIVLGVSGRALVTTLLELTGASDAELGHAYRAHGDLGDAARDLFEAHARAPDAAAALGALDVDASLRAVARAKGPAAKRRELGALLTRATAREVVWIVKLVTGDLRIGLKESLVEEAIAKLSGASHAHVARANLLLGDVGKTLELARSRRLAEATLRLFHPLGAMLASPLEEDDDAIGEVFVEDKYDGIRAQAHVSGGVARLFSRTRDDVSLAFPELVPALAAVTRDAVIDGEIIGYANGRALPFSELQKRLGRKVVAEELQREVPIAFVAFDLLYEDGELLLDRPLEERAQRLERAFASRRPVAAAKRRQLSLFDEAPPPTGALLLAPRSRATSRDEIDARFEEARARGNEGLVLKDPRSPYAPGRRGSAWRKVKRALATLDVVVTAVELGHGKRAHVLSDYTFAVRDGDALKNVGKAYSGLTDKEIAELTTWFEDRTLETRGRVRDVEPTLVIEVAFDRIMKSERHASGYALRFPRIVRLRRDKPAAEADTIADVERIFRAQ